MTAKAWYWTGLGVLILSVGSSNVGRCWTNKASEVIDQLRAKTLPYMAMAEMAMGRTQAGLGHMQAAQARMEAQAARLQAARARLEANRARLEALAGTPDFRHMDVLVNSPAMVDSVIDVPGVTVSPERVVVSGRHALVVCPRTGMKIDVPTPRVSVTQDPI